MVAHRSPYCSRDEVAVDHWESDRIWYRSGTRSKETIVEFLLRLNVCNRFLECLIDVSQFLVDAQKLLLWKTRGSDGQTHWTCKCESYRIQWASISIDHRLNWPFHTEEEEQPSSAYSPSTFLRRQWFPMTDNTPLELEDNLLRGEETDCRECAKWRVRTFDEWRPSREHGIRVVDANSAAYDVVPRTNLIVTHMKNLQID